MSSGGSVSRWVVQLRAGDHRAAQELWERYFRRLVGLARKKLRDTPRRSADEEDVALSAFGCFCRGARQGRFPQLTDREDLWQLLVTITVQKAIDHIRRERRQKRGGGDVLDEAALAGTRGTTADEPGMEQILGREPTPEFAAQVAEECERLLHCLGEGNLRWVALKKMEGYGDEEIAAQLGCARRTIVRKLRRIRNIWSQELLSSAEDDGP
jgi:DNA-directed RNA polymerase specialized sigma24 family protein